MIINLFHYGFVIRAFEAGIIIAAIAPMIGMFLVLRRYALMADTLSHVSFAGVALGLLFGINPLFTAIAASILAATSLERLRAKKRVYGDAALSLFLSGSLALATVLISLGSGFNANLFTYLFGSILTVKAVDVTIIATLGIIVAVVLIALYKELIYVAFDEEAAAVSGLPTRALNFIFVTIAAITIALAIPIVGILLVSALMVIPVVAALQLKRSYKATLIIAECISIVATILGIVIAFALNLSPSGTIVLLMLAIFSIILLAQQFLKN
ncbi:MAG: metal ABC transporter permease [Patescibacteria group bacterium]|jgi:zinc transport system permease protein